MEVITKLTEQSNFMKKRKRDILAGGAKGWAGGAGANFRGLALLGRF